MLKEKICCKLNFITCVRFLYGLLLVAVLLLLCMKGLFPRAFGYFRMPELKCSNLPLILTGVVAIAAVYLLCCRVFRNVRNPKTLAVGVGLLFLLIQLFLIYNYYFETNWDVQQMTGLARASASGDAEAVNSYTWYFSECPNNLFLTSLYAFVFKVMGWFGIFDHYSLIVLQCLFSILVSWMLFQILFRFCDFSTAFFGQLVYLVFIGLSPWLSIPYSDSASLIFCMGMIWIALTSILSQRPGLKWFCIAFVAGIGCLIKPQVLLVFIALLLTVFPASIREIMQKNRVLRRSLVFLLLVVGFCSAILFSLLSVKSIGLTLDKEKAFGMTHYLLMGMNSSSLGDYAAEDVDFAREYSTRSSRAKAELSKTRKRVSKMGVTGLGRLLCEKSILTYGDGTFGWGNEGNFFRLVYPEKNSWASPFARKIYYTGENGGVWNKYWLHFCQIVWLGILFFVALSCFVVKAPTAAPAVAPKAVPAVAPTAVPAVAPTAISAVAPTATTAVAPTAIPAVAPTAISAVAPTAISAVAPVFLALLLLALFELVFECRARYLFAFSPLFILAACMGLNRLKQFVQHKQLIRSK